MLLCNSRSTLMQLKGSRLFSAVYREVRICNINHETRITLSMNLPGGRIAACLGKAALKTHALQTLTRRPLPWPARSVWSASDLSALSVRRGTASGSGSQSTVARPSGFSMNRPTPTSFGRGAGIPVGSLLGGVRGGFMAKKRKRASHHACPTLSSRAPVRSRRCRCLAHSCRR